MSVNSETASAQGQTTVLEKESVYASLFEKIHLTPASSLGDINDFLDDAALSDAPAGERLTAAMQVFMDCIRKSGQQVEKLDNRRCTIPRMPPPTAASMPACRTSSCCRALHTTPDRAHHLSGDVWCGWSACGTTTTAMPVCQWTRR